MGHKHLVKKLLRDQGWLPLGAEELRLDRFRGAVLDDLIMIDHLGFPDVKAIITEYHNIGFFHLNEETIIDQWGDFWALRFQDGCSLIMTHVMRQSLFCRIDSTGEHMVRLQRDGIIAEDTIFYSTLSNSDLVTPTLREYLGGVVDTLEAFKLKPQEPLTSMDDPCFHCWGALRIGFVDRPDLVFAPLFYRNPDLTSGQRSFWPIDDFDKSLVIDRMVYG